MRNGGGLSASTCPMTWHAGLLYDPRDPEFSVRLMEALAATAPELVIGAGGP